MPKQSPVLRSPPSLGRAEEVVDAAARVFAENGYHGASTQAIADQLGLRQASLYYYFSSKEAALEIVCDKGVDSFVGRADFIVAKKESALDRLKEMIAAHLTPVAAEHDYVRVFINERRYLPHAARSRLARKIQRIEKHFADLLQVGMAEGSVRADIDVRKSVLLILSMCNAPVNWPAADRTGLDDVADQIIQLVTRGLALSKASASHDGVQASTETL